MDSPGIEINGEMDEDIFTAEEIEEMDTEARLRSLNSDRDSIKKISEYFINKVDSIAKTDPERAEPTTQLIVQMWARYVLRVPRDKKIAFTYLANDLI